MVNKEVSVEGFLTELKRIYQFRYNHGDISLSLSRKLAEKICNLLAVYYKVNEFKKDTLDKKITKLRSVADKVASGKVKFTSEILNHLDNIRNFGNMASHDHDFNFQPDSNSIINCLTSIKHLSSWYLNNVLGEKIDLDEELKATSDLDYVAVQDSSELKENFDDWITNDKEDKFVCIFEPTPNILKLVKCYFEKKLKKVFKNSINSIDDADFVFHDLLEFTIGISLNNHGSGKLRLEVYLDKTSFEIQIEHTGDPYDWKKEKLKSNGKEAGLFSWFSSEETNSLKNHFTCFENIGAKIYQDKNLKKIKICMAFSESKVNEIKGLIKGDVLKFKIDSSVLDLKGDVSRIASVKNGMIKCVIIEISLKKIYSSTVLELARLKKYFQDAHNFKPDDFLLLIKGDTLRKRINRITGNDYFKIIISNEESNSIMAKRKASK